MNKQSIIAIVGRPNVGKSTLFNRIVGTRSSIVHDTPGVTRDRIYAETEWAGRAFTVVDTGGFVPDSDDLIERSIREQAEAAITESDAVVFVVDGSTGVNPIEASIADLLRRSGRNVVLCVNKVDGAIHEASIHQFHELGLGEPYGVSALSGRAMGDLLDAVIGALPSQSENGDSDESSLRLAVIGRPNVGKSSLVNALVGESRSIVTDIPGTTRDSIDSTFQFYGESFTLIDTAGLRKRGRVNESVEYFSTLRTLQSIERCDIAIVLLDATMGLQTQDLKIIEEAVHRNRGIIIAVNKWDAVEKDSTTAKHFEAQIRKGLRRYNFIPLIFISAMTKQRLQKLIELSKSTYAEMKKRISTSELNDVILPMIKANPHPPIAARELKISFVEQADTAPPVFVFFTNIPEAVEENYTRYIENIIREHYGFTGVPITLRFKSRK